MPLEMIAGSPWAPLIIALTIAGSAVFPPLPSETMLVVATGLALGGKLELAQVLTATTLGALLGDLTAYSVGRVISHRARGRAFRSPRGRAALRWLDEQQSSWGPGLVVAGRFLPGGTTAVGISAGIIAFPLRRFVAAAAAGALLWSGYGLVLAALGQSVFPNSTLLGVAVAVGLTLAVGGAVQVVRLWRIRRRRKTARHDA